MRKPTRPTRLFRPSNDPTSAADRALVRHAARRVGVQIALASAFAITVAAVVAYALIRHHHGDPLVGTAHVEPATDDDADILNALMAAAIFGVLIAGGVAFLIARRAVRPLGQALTLQRRFVADAGHELRTPLTILHTRAQLLARRIPADDPAGPIAAQLLDDSRLLAEIVDELLLAATLTARPELAEVIDPAALLDEVAASMKVLADDSQVELLVTAPPGLQVRGSRPALRRALIALVDNAISHSAGGDTVRLRAGADADKVVFAVTDQGDGLPAGGQQDQVWDRFARGVGDRAGHVAVRPIGNRRYGLGLSLVREIATAHGGAVSLQDAAEGRGAVASLTLPSAGAVRGTR